jgi:hypothetical protein
MIYDHAKDWCMRTKIHNKEAGGRVSYSLYCCVVAVVGVHTPTRRIIYHKL